MINEIMTSEGKFIKVKRRGTKIKIKKNTPLYSLFIDPKSNMGSFGYFAYDSDDFTFIAALLSDDKLYAIVQANATNILYSTKYNGGPEYSNDVFGDLGYNAMAIVKYSDLEFIGGVIRAFYSRILSHFHSLEVAA